MMLLALWQHKTPGKAVIELTSGIVPEDPKDLADTAGVDLDVYTLARIGQSEEGLSSDRAKIAVMYAALNHAKATGKSVTAIATAGNPKRSDYSEADGRYGRQGIHPYCTTIANPTAHTVELAAQVWSGEALDETGGAQYWDNPHSQDVLHAAKPYDESTGKDYRSNSEIAERRIASGFRQHNIPGVSTRFWV